MNNYPFPMMPMNQNQKILEELIRIREILQQIEKNTEKKEPKKENKYLEKDDNFYMV